MKKVFSDIDLHGNALNHAKVTIADRDTIADADVIDKQYVNDEDTYVTDLSDPDTGVNEGKPLIGFGGITTDIVVHGKTTRELWDIAMYPLASPTYLTPVTSISTVVYTDVSKSSPYFGNLEVGQSVWLDHTINVTLRDSVGLDGTNPYTWSGSEILGSLQTGFDTISLNYNANMSQSWQCITAYLGADIKNDTHGNPDATGQFDAGTVNTSKSITGYWPMWRQVIDGDVSAPISGTELRAISGKELSNIDTVFDLTIPGDSNTKTIIIAIPVGAGDANISAIKDGAVPIAPAAWQKSRLTSIPDLENSGQTIDYIVFRHDNGIGFGTESTYSITLTLI